MKFYSFISFYDQLQEELERARCIMVDGDAATYLRGKNQGAFPILFSFSPILDIGSPMNSNKAC